MVEYIVAIDVTRVRFPADAFLCFFLLRLRRNSNELAAATLSSLSKEEHMIKKKTTRSAEKHRDEANKSTPVGFEPTRGDPIGLAGRRLNRSAKVSYGSVRSTGAKILNAGLSALAPAPTRIVLSWDCNGGQ